MLTLILLRMLSAAPNRPIEESTRVVPVAEAKSPAFVLEPAEPPPVVEEKLGEQMEKETPGSRWGFASLAAFNLSVKMQVPFRPLNGSTREPDVTGGGGMFGIGVRRGLWERTLGRQWMPAVSFLVGTSVTTRGISPFTEARFEWLTVSAGGPLQPNFVVYAGSGLTMNMNYGNGPSLSPHVGMGIGWNWLPKGGGGGGGWGGGGWSGGWGGGGGGGLLVALPAAAAVGLMIFAGRLEVRYVTRPMLGPGSDYFAVMFGAGT